MKKIFETNESWAPLVLRVFLTLVIFPHGVQKLLGWFGGFGFSGTMSFFTDTMDFPWLLGLFIILLESVGAIILLAGLGTRILALFFAILGLGIVLSSHIQHGFFMNWFGNQSGEGYEYFLLWLGIAGALILTGGGKYSLDMLLMQNDMPES